MPFDLGLARPFSWRESALASAALLVVAALAFGPFVKHGGFFLDDWSNGAGTLQPPGSPDVGSALSYYVNLTEFRPVLIVYVPLTYFVFGMHIHLHDAWSVLVAVGAASAFYAVLRTLGTPWLHAWLIAALTIVFPWSDATRFWVTGDQVNLSIAIMGLGMLLALGGLRRGDWKRHAAADALYLVSILTYEVTLPLIACMGFLYWIRAGWRAARFRWLADLVVVVVAGAWVGGHTKRTTSSFAYDIEHLGEIVNQGGVILGRAGMPLGSPRTTLVLVVLGAVLAAGLAAYLFRRRQLGSRAGWGLRGWLFLSGAGLCVAALGWVMFIPAEAYYTPSVYGLVNRVNGMAGFGLVMLVYGSLGVFSSLVGELRPKSRWLAAGMTTCLALVLLGSYTHVLRRHTTIWDEAYDAQIAGLTELRRAIPSVPRGGAIFVGSYPAYQTLGVPIFSSTSDFDGMVKLEYDDFSLSGSPVFEGLRIACYKDGMALAGEGAPGAVTPYGSVRMLNFQTGEVAAPRDPRHCKRVAKSYVPGPAYLSFAY